MKYGEKDKTHVPSTKMETGTSWVIFHRNSDQETAFSEEIRADSKDQAILEYAEKHKLKKGTWLAILGNMSFSYAVLWTDSKSSHPGEDFEYEKRVLKGYYQVSEIVKPEDQS